MAERRMMTKKVIHSDAFLDMPTSSQNLYFHLLLEADDEGFVNSPKRVQRTIGASDDDAKILLAKKFIISFDSGVIVIKHWKMHNYIQNDRFKSSTHTEERAMLSLKENNVYTMDPNCTPSIGKDRLGEVSIVEDKYIAENNLDMIKEIIKHLNQVCKTNYRHSTPKTKTLINARLKEGFTVDDFKQVHIIKFSEWTGTDMQKYLRPETLYSPKFEGYLNQKTTDYDKMRAINEHTGLSALELLKQQGYA